MPRLRGDSKRTPKLEARDRPQNKSESEQASSHDLHRAPARGRKLPKQEKCSSASNQREDDVFSNHQITRATRVNQEGKRGKAIKKTKASRFEAFKLSNYTAPCDIFSIAIVPD